MEYINNIALTDTEKIYLKERRKRGTLDINYFTYLCNWIQTAHLA